MERIKQIRMDDKALEFYPGRPDILLSCIMGNSLDGILVYKAIRDEKNKIIDFEYLLVNDSAYNILGRGLMELRGKRLLQQYPGTKKEGLFDRCVKVVETGIPDRFELYYPHENLHHWFIISLVKLDDGVVTTFADITELKETEYKLKEQQNFIRAIADATPNLIFVYDLFKKKYVYVNKELTRVLGYTFKELNGEYSKIVKDLIHPDDQDMILTQLKMLILCTEEDLLQSEFRMKHADGKWKWLSVRVKIFKKDTEGKILQTIGIAHDITSRKHAEEGLRYANMELSKANEELRLSNAELERFAFVASHDLQEPLRKINTFADRLYHSYRKNLDTQGLHYLKTMLQSVSRIQLLIEDLLVFSRLSLKGKKFVKTDLGIIIRDVLSDLEKTIQKKHAKITIVEPFATTRAIPDQLRKLFANLITNSLKFHKKGEAPAIKIHSEILKGADIEGISETEKEKEKEFCRVYVEDQGIGFDEKYLDLIFIIFQRLNARYEYEGTGIGLAICKKIADNHKGLITAHSKPGKGAAFIVTLPCLS